MSELLNIKSNSALKAKGEIVGGKFGLKKKTEDRGGSTLKKSKLSVSKFYFCWHCCTKPNRIIAHFLRA